MPLLSVPVPVPAAFPAATPHPGISSSTPPEHSHSLEALITALGESEPADDNANAKSIKAHPHPQQKPRRAATAPVPASRVEYDVLSVPRVLGSGSPGSSGAIGAFLELGSVSGSGPGSGSYRSAFDVTGDGSAIKSPVGVGIGVGSGSTMMSPSSSTSTSSLTSPSASLRSVSSSSSLSRPRSVSSRGNGHGHGHLTVKPRRVVPLPLPVSSSGASTFSGSSTGIGLGLGLGLGIGTGYVDNVDSSGLGEYSDGAVLQISSGVPIHADSPLLSRGRSSNGGSRATSPLLDFGHGYVNVGHGGHDHDHDVEDYLSLYEGGGGSASSSSSSTSPPIRSVSNPGFSFSTSSSLKKTSQSKDRSHPIFPSGLQHDKHWERKVHAREFELELGEGAREGVGCVEGEGAREGFGGCEGEDGDGDGGERWWCGYEGDWNWKGEGKE